jgi:hypothetical protein
MALALIAALPAALAGCGAGAPERAFERYRQAVVASDWELAWSMLSEDLRQDYSGSADLYASEMTGFFVKPDLRLQFSSARVREVILIDEGRAAELRASYETPSGGREERSWRLVNTEEGWKLDEL